MAEPRIQQGPIVFAGQRRLCEANAVFRGDLMAARLGGNDGDLTGIDFEVAHQQRQDPLADAAEADDDEPSGKGGVLLIQHGNRAMIGLSGSAYGRCFLLSSQGMRIPSPASRCSGIFGAGWVTVCGGISIHKIAQLAQHSKADRGEDRLSATAWLFNLKKSPRCRLAVDSVDCNMRSNSRS